MKNVVCNVVKMSLGTVVMLVGMGANPAQAAFLGGDGCRGDQLNLGLIVRRGCSLEVGDKEFYDFRAGLTQDGDADPNQLNDILISAVEGASPGFDILSGFFAGPNSNVDLDLTYRVRVLDPTQWLSGVTLAFNGFAVGTGLAQITETVFDQNLNAIGQAFVDTANPLGSLSDRASFDPIRQVLINKDIKVRGGTDGSASISFIRNQHDQIPTPALLPGLVGLGVTAWRKRRQEAVAIAA
jgi:hypothetical protein